MTPTQVPGRPPALRVETRTPSQDLRVEASLSGMRLEPIDRSAPELFTPVAVNRGSALRDNLKFFRVPVLALRFGANRIQVRNLDHAANACDFISSELGLYLKR